MLRRGFRKRVKLPSLEGVRRDNAVAGVCPLGERTYPSTPLNRGIAYGPRFVQIFQTLKETMRKRRRYSIFHQHNIINITKSIGCAMG
jgi:hypothetical protein